jgi:hypothetical protein
LFFLPIVIKFSFPGGSHIPQAGKLITILHLTAAHHVLKSDAHSCIVFLKYT